MELIEKKRIERDQVRIKRRTEREKTEGECGW